MLQPVFVVSKGMGEKDALAVVGLTRKDYSFVLQMPALQDGEGIRVTCVWAEYSADWHGNPRPESFEMPCGAWAVRMTCYTSIHGGTWARRLAQMKPDLAELNLSSFAELNDLSLPRQGRGGGGKRARKGGPSMVGWAEEMVEEDSQWVNAQGKRVDAPENGALIKVGHAKAAIGEVQEWAGSGTVSEEKWGGSYITFGDGRRRYLTDFVVWDPCLEGRSRARPR